MGLLVSKLIGGWIPGFWSGLLTQLSTLVGRSTKHLDLEEVYNKKCHGGRQVRYAHCSKVCNNRMTFSVYWPPPADAATKSKSPWILALPGLTTSDEYFFEHCQIQQSASAYRIPVVSPDTSPRNTGVEGESEDYRWGEAAGFYCNATVAKWRKWQMYDYVTKELPEVLAHNFGSELDMGMCSLLGHSMGGHGALTIYLKASWKYQACSVINAVSNPTAGVWGPVVLGAYLGEHDKEAWKAYDATDLAKAYEGEEVTIWQDQGMDDPYLNYDILHTNLAEVARGNPKIAYTLTERKGYDHGSACVATFVGEHVRWHSDRLKGA